MALYKCIVIVIIIINGYTDGVLLVAEIELEEDELLEQTDVRRRRTEQIATSHLLVLLLIHTRITGRQNTDMHVIHLLEKRVKGKGTV